MSQRRQSRAGACVRIDPQTGERTIIRSPSRTSARLYTGQYGLWNDQCQTWEGGPYTSINALAAAFYYYPELLPMRWAGEFNPKPLTRAEQRQISTMLEDAG